MAGELKDEEQLTARQRFARHCAKKAEFIAFSNLELTELEILSYSKAKLT
jgi:hypothetical protein